MGLSSDLISQFVKSTKDDNKSKKESTVHGTIVEYNGSKYVKLDGSDLLTPISTTADAKSGERVTVMIKDHTATVTGNVSSPSARTDDVKEIGSKISEFEIIIAHRVVADDIEATNALIGSLKATVATLTSLSADQIAAVSATIETIQSDIINSDYLTANDIKAIDAEIENLRSTFGKFENISTTDLEAVNAEIDHLKTYSADFTYVSTDVLSAVKADIKTLDAEKLSAKDADLKYANIDFSNIGKAAIEQFYATSGIIKDLVIGDTSVTGKLVGVTITGDLIEGGTVKADKLVILGEDGLYYKLNVNSLGEATASSDPKYQNGLDGSVIVANSITAEKVNVKDLVAFDATIGGFNITDSAIYSGVKTSADNTTRGIYLDKTGQFSVGDSSNYFRYYKVGDAYKLEISAQSIILSSSKTNIETEINKINSNVEDAILNIDQYYYDTFQSKIGNLVKNGYGEYLDNTGFFGTTFTRGDCPEGCYGYFWRGHTEENIPFDKNSIYKYEYYCRLHEGRTGNAFFSIDAFDVDGKEIRYNNILDYNKNLFYLSQDLKDGDTIVHFTDLSNWNISTTTAGERSFLIFGYEDSTGYVYPDGTYSRNFYSSIYSSNESVDMINNTITLSSAWTRGLVKAGTCIGQTKVNRNGLCYGQNGAITNTDWQKWSGTVKADPNGDERERRLAYAKEIRFNFTNAIADFAGIYFGKQAVDDIARDAANDAQSKANEIGAKLEILENSVLTLVKDENGQTSLVQDSSGWTFNITDTENKINDASSNISDIQNSLNGTSDETGIIQKLDILNDSVNDLNKLSNYIKITTDGNQPCIELGSDASDFKVLITNTDIKFMEGSSVPASISNESLNIGKANIKDELKQGGFVWRARGENGNGNLGLIWKGSDT